MRLFNPNVFNSLGVFNTKEQVVVITPAARFSFSLVARGSYAPGVRLSGSLAAREVWAVDHQRGAYSVQAKPTFEVIA